ncbi:MAG: hypothetical protein ONB46_14310 [candidate division KSB1 bacterium]|nr:hypothetical protein [candidate division KSB1 bacterium]MDZ7366887.1 hypothetical protein [candidate division KSB1 bacterium]MDZ7406056.1 hypothetical protein [candidate division KSB1 bacterium]
MFRIKKVFENLSLAIYKIEGKVTDESLQIWKEELQALNHQPDRKIILDFCHAWSISAPAIDFRPICATETTMFRSSIRAWTSATCCTARKFA